jgi:hypothetical protein
MGWGKEVTIPSLLISKKDGHMVKKYLDGVQDKNFEIKVQLDFTVPMTDKVFYELYFINGFQNAYPLMKDLKEMHALLGDKVSFEPKYDTHKNLINGLRVDCIGEGKYCNYDGNWYYKTTGREIILHNVMEKCVWRLLKNDTAFFEYVDRYIDCAKIVVPNKDKRDECLDTAVDKLGIIKTEEVRNCYASNISVLSKL